jgi:glycosyltransferase domain-containing protein
MKILNQNLSRLTLVIPSYNRQDFVLRVINYWADKGPRLIVLDGSAKPIETAKLDIFRSRIQYLHRPVGMYQRLMEAMDLVVTDFVAYAGDDEFYIPSAVESCIRELEKDDDLIACCGRALGFSSMNQRVAGFPQYPRLEEYVVDADSAEERVVQHMRDYVPSLIYAICRASQWKTAWRYALQTEFHFFASGELQLEMFMAYAGRSRVLPELMWLRSHGETESVRGTDLWLDDKKTFPAWWADSSKVSEHEEFVSIMSQGFSELLPGACCDLRATVVAGMQAYLDFYRNHTNSRGLLTILKRLARKTIPGFGKPFLKSILRGLRRSKLDQHTELLQAARFIEESGVYVDFQALEEIEETIIQFHKNTRSLGV